MGFMIAFLLLHLIWNSDFVRGSVAPGRAAGLTV